jgi:uroporphyrinogen-III synthase
LIRAGRDKPVGRVKLGCIEPKLKCLRPSAASMATKAYLRAHLGKPVFTPKRHRNTAALLRDFLPPLQGGSVRNINPG